MKKILSILMLVLLTSLLQGCPGESNTNTAMNGTANSNSAANANTTTTANVPTPLTTPTLQSTTSNVQDPSLKNRSDAVVPKNSTDPLVMNTYQVLGEWSDTLESKEYSAGYSGLLQLKILWRHKHRVKPYETDGVHALINNLKNREYFKKCMNEGKINLDRSDFNTNPAGINTVGRLYEKLKPCSAS